MKTLTATITAAVVVALASGCAGVEIDNGDELPAGAVLVPTERVAYEQYSGIEDRRRVVIRTEAEWRAFWNEVTENMSPRPSRPAIDFDREIVIAAAMGEQRTGGYEIEIENVYDTAGGLVAVVEEMRPEAGCPATQALTAPVDIVRVPVTQEGVGFAERETVVECE